MYYLEGLDEFVGLAQSTPTCPAGFTFSNGQCVSGVSAALAPATPPETQYEPVTSKTNCSASDCNCWYSKAVNNIEYYNTANKSVSDYKTYKANFASRYNKYLQCAKAAGITPVQLNINTPPPGVTFSAPGAGANVLASSGISSSLLPAAQSLLTPGAQVQDSGSMMEKVGISVGGALVLGTLVLLLTGKKKSLVAAPVAATHASPVPGVVAARPRIRYTTRRVYAHRRRR